MTPPTVSVIIPVLNGEAFLRQAVESALAQTAPPLEIIVIDDGSTDRTGEIARSLPVVYLRQVNRGLPTARNSGIENARGELLAFLDADDLWLANKLDLQLAALVKDPEAGYALSHMRYFADGDGSPPAWFHRRGPESGEPGYSPSCWLIRRGAWERVGPFRPEMRSGEDIDWLARANDLSVRAIMAPEVLVLKRVHDANMTANLPALKRGLLDALRPSLARKRGQHPGPQ